MAFTWDLLRSNEAFDEPDQALFSTVISLPLSSNEVHGIRLALTGACRFFIFLHHRLPDLQVYTETDIFQRGRVLMSG